VLALRILAAVLAAARPQAGHHDSSGLLLPQHVPFPECFKTEHNIAVSKLSLTDVVPVLLHQVEAVTTDRFV